MNKLPQRFVDKIRHEGDCWVWTAFVDKNGYGKVSWEGGSKWAHRVVYLILVGPIPEGMVLDHICFNKRCVNPKHLRAITQKQNIEHRSGAQSNSRSGVRGVVWSPDRGKWQVSVGHAGRTYNGGRFVSLDDAKAAVAALRKKLFTHDDGMSE